jgi:hypothetical protein
MRGCDFFEGVVMNRVDSAYPVQLRSATEELRAAGGPHLSDMPAISPGKIVSKL